MKAKFIVYRVTSYTGTLVARQVKTVGLDVGVTSRDPAELGMALAGYNVYALAEALSTKERDSGSVDRALPPIADT